MVPNGAKYHIFYSVGFSEVSSNIVWWNGPGIIPKLALKYFGIKIRVGRLRKLLVIYGSKNTLTIW